jgi:hypothetical protein
MLSRCAASAHAAPHDSTFQIEIDLNALGEHHQ